MRVVVVVGAALALVAAAAAAAVLLPPAACSPTCQQIGSQSGPVEGRCPVELTSVRIRDPDDMYSECVTVRVRLKANDLKVGPTIGIHSQSSGRTLWPQRKKERKIQSCRQQLPNSREVVCDCVKVKDGDSVSVSFRKSLKNCSVTHTVQDQAPEFDLSVDRTAKSIAVSVKAEDEVCTRRCYQKSEVECIGLPDSPQVTIDPSQSPSAVFHFPFLLPCACIQVYYTHRDARRRTKCPLRKDIRLTNVEDVWPSSDIKLYESSLRWSPVCPTGDLNVSASLCWRQHTHLCTPVLNSTLEVQDNGFDLIYNTSAVDKHPQMCVQFSLEGSNNISCPFLADMSSWEVRIGPGRQSVFVYLTSSVPAAFSAQLCVLSDVGCSPMGPVHTLRMQGKPNETRMDIPPHFLAEKPCVQVWQSDPALQGRRIMCLDYTHHRCGVYAAAVLILLAVIAIFILRLTKSGSAGWPCVQRPVLLVCSSAQSAHVSAACALASILQGELGATVHMALCARSSQGGAGAGTGVADLGPLPWLYGQWEAVREAQGRVLIVWSPEAKATYERWTEERAGVDMDEATKQGERIRVGEEEERKLNGSRPGKSKKEKAAGRKENVESCDDRDRMPQEESSSVIGPVFAAALACLQGALRAGKGQEVAIVYFQGLGHSRDIPKALRDVPRYCLPQNFRGLIQELGGVRRGAEASTSKRRCWPRLLSKVRSIWLARQLSRRLQALVPQTRGKRTSARRQASGRPRGGPGSPPPAADAARPEAARELEPLRGSPWRPEEL